MTAPTPAPGTLPYKIATERSLEDLREMRAALKARGELVEPFVTLFLEKERELILKQERR